MKRTPGARRAALLRDIVVYALSAVLIAAVIWVDIATGFWEDKAIVSGLVVGVVTFLLTVVVIDRVIARSTARRWAPVNRLALTDFLHVIADETRSEVDRGIIVARELPGVVEEDDAALARALDELRARVVSERARLSDVLSRWAGFLASSGDNESILRHIAEIALQFDLVREATLRVEAGAGGRIGPRADLDARIDRCNAAILELAGELQTRLSTRGDGSAANRVKRGADGSAGGAPRRGR